MIEMAKTVPYLWQKRLKTLAFEATHNYIAHIGEYPTGVRVKKKVFVSRTDGPFN